MGAVGKSGNGVKGEAIGVGAGGNSGGTSMGILKPSFCKKRCQKTFSSPDICNLFISSACDDSSINAHVRNFMILVL